MARLTDHYTAPEWGTAALITIDTQRDVLDDGVCPIPGTSAVLPAMRRVIETFRVAGRPVVHIVRLYERDVSNADPCRRALLAGGAPVLVRDTVGCELATELLRDRGISTLVFMGCNFPNCPRASIYEASERDFRLVVVRDAISGLYERGQRELIGIGVRLMTADEVSDALRVGEPISG
jgi:nicotinamidase-related amidase